jgi:PII-like signaling protein
MPTQVTVIRVTLHESDHGRRKSLMDDVLHLLREQVYLTSVSVFRGIAGLDGKDIVYASNIMYFNVDLPLVIQFSVEMDRAEAAIAALSAIVPPEHILSWPATRHGAHASRQQ